MAWLRCLAILGRPQRLLAKKDGSDSPSGLAARPCQAAAPCGEEPLMSLSDQRWRGVHMVLNDLASAVAPGLLASDSMAIGRCGAGTWTARRGDVDAWNECNGEEIEAIEALWRNHAWPGQNNLLLLKHTSYLAGATHKRSCRR